MLKLNTKRPERPLKILGLLGCLLTAGLLAACGSEGRAAATDAAAPAVNAAPAAPLAHSGGQTLIVYFSRYGNTAYPANIDASASASVLLRGGERRGTTEELARLIREQTGGRLQLIRTVQPYPDAFNGVVDLNHREMAEKHLPPLQADDLDMSRYDTVFIGYPVWANTIPQAVAAWLQSHDLSGKTVVPFCTHDGYRSGRSYSDIARLSQTKVLPGLALEVRELTDAGRAQSSVTSWLQQLELPRAQQQSSAASVSVGGQQFSAVWGDSPLAQEIRSMLPLSIAMYNYGGRELYGPLPVRPQLADSTEGSLRFQNGDITYCPQNNTLAIFYSKQEQQLGMRVIRVGRVSSGLEPFERLDGGTETVVFRAGQE